MKRRESRQLALELIFEGSFHDFSDPALIYDTAREIRCFEDDEYVRKLFFGVCDNRESIDAAISDNSKGWKLERISRLILSVLRLSVYELKFCEDVPFNVAINEAVELTKEYDFEASPAFVNGVLNAIAEAEGLKG
ncbi:MAG: transcription antitermination factor NusB [Clostridia bacterium]|nr:transcription antitermination factor NusB [Clostridia bacterium]